MCGGLKLVPSVFYHPLPYSLRQALSLNLEHPDLARLADQQAPGVLLSSLPSALIGDWCVLPCLAFPD